jgi:hypothetical protein
MPECTSFPTEAHLDARGQPRLNTIKSQFYRLVQVRESNPRHTVYETVALPI